MNHINFFTEGDIIVRDKPAINGDRSYMGEALALVAKDNNYISAIRINAKFDCDQGKTIQLLYANYSTDWRFATNDEIANFDSIVVMQIANKAIKNELTARRFLWHVVSASLRQNTSTAVSLALINLIVHKIKFGGADNCDMTAIMEELLKKIEMPIKCPLQCNTSVYYTIEPHDGLTRFTIDAQLDDEDAVDIQLMLRDHIRRLYNKKNKR